MDSEQVSSDQAKELLRMASMVPGEFSASERTLVDAVSELTVGDTRRALEYWR
jgi:hypothetical protein